MVNKTAIQWLYEQYRKEAIPTDAIVDLFRKAEAMEKQQIIEANENQCIDEDGDFMTGEQYYNETFKSE